MTRPGYTTWMRVQALAWAPALVAAAWLEADAAPAALVAAAAGIAASYVALALVLRAGRTVADAATFARAAALLLWLWAIAARPFGDGPVAASASWTVAALIAAGDLVDGALARRFGATPAGSVLDMETDQFVVLGFALAVVAAGGAPHVLLLPLMRYAFVLLAWSCGVPSDDPKPVDGDNRRGRAVCAAVVVLLLAALLPLDARWPADVASGLAVLLLAWSFAGDWTFLFARRVARTGG